MKYESSLYEKVYVHKSKEKKKLKDHPSRGQTVEKSFSFLKLVNLKLIVNIIDEKFHKAHRYSISYYIYFLRIHIIHVANTSEVRCNGV